MPNIKRRQETTEAKPRPPRAEPFYEEGHPHRVQEGDCGRQGRQAEEAETELRKAAKLLDKSAAKHVIHRNAAARVKSRLSAKVKTLKGK